MPNGVNGTMQVPAWIGKWAIGAFRTVVATSCVLAWNLFLDIHDIKNKLEELDAPDATLSGSLPRKDWEYEKKLLLVDHNQFERQLTVEQDDIKELKAEVKEIENGD